MLAVNLYGWEGGREGIHGQLCTCSYRGKTLYIRTGPVAEQPRRFSFMILFCIFWMGYTQVSFLFVCFSCPVPPVAAWSTLCALVFYNLSEFECARVCVYVCAQWPQLRLRLASNWVCLTATGCHLWPLGRPHLLSLSTPPNPLPTPDIPDQLQFKNFIYLLALILLESNYVTNEALRCRQHSYPSFFIFMFCKKNNDSSPKRELKMVHAVIIIFFFLIIIYLM